MHGYKTGEKTSHGLWLKESDMPVHDSLTEGEETPFPLRKAVWNGWGIGHVIIPEYIPKIGPCHILPVIHNRFAEDTHEEMKGVDSLFIFFYDYLYRAVKVNTILSCCLLITAFILNSEFPTEQKRLIIGQE